MPAIYCNMLHVSAPQTRFPSAHSSLQTWPQRNATPADDQKILGDMFSDIQCMANFKQYKHQRVIVHAGYRKSDAKLFTTAVQIC